jgi:hypothetical protein
MTMQPRVTDNDKGEISVTLNDKELRGWSYKDDSERRAKMLAAREYVEGWCDARQDVAALVKEFEAIAPFDAETLQDLRRMIPFGLYDAGGAVTQNPLTQVYFRAGLLACREYMARFVEQGGDATTAASIRANWWPSLGDDPGPPRLFDFAELCEESDGPDGKPVFKTLTISPSIEALAPAYQFLIPPADASTVTSQEREAL